MRGLIVGLFLGWTVLLAGMLIYHDLQNDSPAVVRPSAGKSRREVPLDLTQEEPNFGVFWVSMDRTWRAICTVESRNQPLAYNRSEQAAGIAQIRPICIDDCNRIVKDAGGPPLYWHMDQRFDPGASREMFVTYVVYYARAYHTENNTGQRPEIWARIWNGGPTGPKRPTTLHYWHLIEAAMGEVK